MKPISNLELTSSLCKSQSFHLFSTFYIFYFPFFLLDLNLLKFKDSPVFSSPYPHLGLENDFHKVAAHYIENKKCHQKTTDNTRVHNMKRLPGVGGRWERTRTEKSGKALMQNVTFELCFNC